MSIVTDLTEELARARARIAALEDLLIDSKELAHIASRRTKDAGHHTLSLRLTYLVKMIIKNGI